MDVTLRPVTPDNWRACLTMKLHPHQERFVAPNVRSLAQAYIYAEDTPLVIYAGDLPVGFLMYALDPSDNNYWIFRFMIDREHQGRGYARAAFLEYIEFMKALPECDAIWLSIAPDNQAAEQLYRSLGFAPTGKIHDDGDIEMCLRLDRPEVAKSDR